MNQTSEIVAELYRVFSRYELDVDFTNGDVVSCPERSQLLASKSLHELTVDELNLYAFKAMTTMGGVDHFKHFLPRLFELVLVNGTEPFNFPETLFGKLTYARWMDWPTVEYRIVERFLDTFWFTSLQRPITSVDDDSVDAAICSLGQACQSVDRFLTTWTGSTEPCSVRQLAQFIWINADVVLTKNHLWNAFWDNRPAANEVLAWLKTDAVVNALNKGASALTGHLTYAPAQLDAIRAGAMPSMN